MFPIGWPVAAFFFLLHALAGAAIGALTGLLLSLTTRRTARAFLRHGFLGVIGYFIGFLGCIFTPWPENTITYRLEGGALVTETANIYQHPERVAIIVAILLPLLNELYRWRKQKTAKLS